MLNTYLGSKGKETRSEAVLLEAASTDGHLAFTLRLCRYPELGISWLWGHVFAGGKVYVFADHAQPCDSSVTNLDTDSVVYTHGAGTAPAFRFERVGPLLGPSSCSAQASFQAAEGARAVLGEGGVPVEVTAQLRPLTGTVNNVEGRTEVLGMVDATIVLGGRELRLSAPGHFHEQEQRNPRFMTGFTYCTLRREDGGILFIRGPKRGGGTLLHNDEATRIERVELGPPGLERALALHLSGGRILEGTATATYRHVIPIYSDDWFGSVVRVDLDGLRYTGRMNDYLPEMNGYDR